MEIGTVVAFWGTDWLSRLISWSTWGPSHVGIIAELNGQLVLFESTTLCKTPCLIQGKCVSGVQAQNIEDRVKQYRGGSVKYYPLHSHLNLNETESTKMSNFLISQIGKEYDKKAAVLSASHILKYFPNPDLDTIFCSALVARALMISGRMPWANPETYSPASLLRTLKKSAILK